MTTNLSIPDQRMIILMEYAVKNDLALNEGDYWQQIGFPRSALSGVKKGLQSFRIEHITNACLLTGASADWVLGIEKNVFRKGSGKTPIQLLRETILILKQSPDVPDNKPLATAEQEKKINHIIRETSERTFTPPPDLKLIVKRSKKIVEEAEEMAENNDQSKEDKALEDMKEKVYVKHRKRKLIRDLALNDEIIDRFIDGRRLPADVKKAIREYIRVKTQGLKRNK